MQKLRFKIKNFCRSTLDGSRYTIRGSSLLEVLMYSGLLALFLTISFIMVSSILGTSSRVIDRNEVITNEEFIDRKMAWLVSQASGITSPAENTSGSTLTLSGSQPLIFPATISLDNQQLILTLNGGTATPITNNRVYVASFTADNITTSTILREVRSSVTLESVTDPNITSTINFAYALP